MSERHEHEILKVEACGDAVVLTIDRPTRHNAIDRALAKKIAGALKGAAEQENVCGIVLTAAVRQPADCSRSGSRGTRVMHKSLRLRTPCAGG